MLIMARVIKKPEKDTCPSASLQKKAAGQTERNVED